MLGGNRCKTVQLRDFLYSKFVVLPPSKCEMVGCLVSIMPVCVFDWE